MLVNNNSSPRPLSEIEFWRKLDDAIAASRAWVLDVGEGTSVFRREEAATLLLNGALLHMVADCAQLSSDQRLRSVAAKYFQVTKAPYCFGRLVDPSSHFERPPDDDERILQDYQRWFLHAVAPTDYLLSAEDRADMFSPNKYHTGSATHQLIALYLYRKFNGDTPDLERIIRQISVQIASEASLDFRVTDLYLQRIACLLAAGQEDLVKRRWVERALAAQQADGGWTYSWHGWGPKPFRFQFVEELSTSHPTVQGMWIAYMLKYRYPHWIEKNYPPTGTARS
jgi:hypothetical protein